MRDVQSARYQAEHLNSLPPTDRRPKQEDESIPGAVSALILQDSSEGLGSMVTAGPIYPELLAKCVDKENPLRTNFGIHPTGTPTRTRHHCPRYRHPHTTDQKRKRASTRCPQANTRQHDQGNKVQRIRHRSKSMVRRQEHQKALRQSQTLPKAIQTLQGSRKNIFRGLQITDP